MEASATELTSEDTAEDTVYSAFSVSETHFTLSRVSAFPRCVFQMHWIKALSLHACEFCEIPPEISALSNLEDLFISECHALDSLCPEIGDLSNLTTLYIYHCERFSAIPESIGRLQKLKTLYFITCTKLEKFPTSLVSLGSLESLIIDETGFYAVLKESHSFRPRLDGDDFFHCFYQRARLSKIRLCKSDLDTRINWRSLQFKETASD
jgi:hypothetical protein